MTFELQKLRHLDAAGRGAERSVVVKRLKVADHLRWHGDYELAERYYLEAVGWLDGRGGTHVDAVRADAVICRALRGRLDEAVELVRSMAGGGAELETVEAALTRDLEERVEQDVDTAATRAALDLVRQRRSSLRPRRDARVRVNRGFGRDRRGISAPCRIRNR